MGGIKLNQNDIYSREEKHRLNEERRLIEAEFGETHRSTDDDELLQIVRDKAFELGRPPKKSEVIGFVYIKSRLGPWPRVLEKAGLKRPRDPRPVASKKKCCKRPG